MQKALDALEERRLGETLGSSAGHLLMSELDRQGVHLLEEEADRLVEGGVIVLEKLNLKVDVWESHFLSPLICAQGSVCFFMLSSAACRAFQAICGVCLVNLSLCQISSLFLATGCFK